MRWPRSDAKFTLPTPFGAVPVAAAPHATPPAVGGSGRSLVKPAVRQEKAIWLLYYRWGVLQRHLGHLLAVNTQPLPLSVAQVRAFL